MRSWADGSSAAVAPQRIVRGGRTGLGMTGLWRGGGAGLGQGKTNGAAARRCSNAQLPARTEGWGRVVGSPGYPLTPPDPLEGTGRGSLCAGTHLSARHVGSAPRSTQFPQVPLCRGSGLPRAPWCLVLTLHPGFVPRHTGVAAGDAATARHVHSPLVATNTGGTAMPPRSRAQRGEGPPRVPRHPSLPGPGWGGGRSGGAGCGARLHARPRGCPGSAGSTGAAW